MHRETARQISTSRRRNQRQRRTTNQDLRLGRVAPDIPPDRLLEGRISGHKLANLVVVLGLACRRKRGEEERASNNTKRRSDREHGDRARFVRELDGRNACEAHDKDAGQVESQREGDGDAVDGDGEGGRMQLGHKGQEFAVIQAASLGVHVGEGAEEVEGERGGEDFDGEGAEGSEGARCVEVVQKVSLASSELAMTQCRRSWGAYTRSVRHECHGCSIEAIQVSHPREGKQDTTHNKVSIPQTTTASL